MYQMSKANNSKNWIKNHVKDPFVIQAQKDGYRSRLIKSIKLLNQVLPQ